MMRVVLASTFFLALTDVVSSEMIDCYFCSNHVSDDLKSRNFCAPGGGINYPSEICTDPIDNSSTTPIDNEIYNCATINIKGMLFTTGSVGDTAEVIFRMATPKDFCPILDIVFKTKFDESYFLKYGLYATLACTECNENLCNKA